ncbi:hypothetical protein TCAL_06689 [Tigriopus californicus]|uniref:Uncharacterized protein n=1 Tax=Tigriopus californicus TaxID=6832 RepID=A0A553P640_TIGCA|nr:hypothetical protein TCAL_06689 [Tigriopus californicus]
MPMQPIRPIQPVQGIPQNVPVSYPQPQTHQYPQTSSHPGNGGGVSQMPINQAPVNTGGVSLAPGGRTGHGKMVQGHGGSMESLNSTNSSTLSTLSYGSTISTGSGHGPLRSSLKKTKHKEVASDTASVTSSKRTRFSLGTEQTSV